MNDEPDTARTLLRDAERYLSAMHGSVARHDNLAANLGCAGCELRDRLAAELRAEPSSAGVPPAPDQTAIERVRAVLETEAVVGRSALEYRGLITTALIAAEATPDPAERSGCMLCGHLGCMGKGRRCGVTMTSESRVWGPPCQCLGTDAAVVQPQTGDTQEADRG